MASAVFKLLCQLCESIVQYTYIPTLITKAVAPQRVERTSLSFRDTTNRKDNMTCILIYSIIHFGCHIWFYKATSLNPTPPEPHTHKQNPLLCTVLLTLARHTCTSCKYLFLKTSDFFFQQSLINLFLVVFWGKLKRPTLCSSPDLLLWPCRKVMSNANTVIVKVLLSDVYASFAASCICAHF